MHPGEVVFYAAEKTVSELHLVGGLYRQLPGEHHRGFGPAQELSRAEKKGDAFCLCNAKRKESVVAQKRSDFRQSHAQIPVLHPVHAQKQELPPNLVQVNTPHILRLSCNQHL